MDAPPICVGCSHKHRVDGAGGTCAVFPDGIPQAIFICREDHRYPYPGDGGVVFAPTDDAADSYATNLLGPVRDYPPEVLRYGAAGRKLYDTLLAHLTERGSTLADAQTELARDWDVHAQGGNLIPL